MTVTDETEVDAEVETEADAVEESVEEPTEEKAVEEDVVPERRPRKWLWRSLLGVLIAALLGVSGFLGWQVWQQHQVDNAAREGQAAAVRYAQVLTSIDSNNVDQNFTDVLNGATGEFKDMYSQSSAQLRQLLVDNKATAHGVVIDSAVQSASKDKVVVMLFVDQTVANKAAPDPRIDRSRIKMTLEKVDGTWRASKVQIA